jgi:hypothetical protein
MKRYEIWHSVGEDKFSEVEHQEREYVATVMANSIEMAYRASQNHEWAWNIDSPCRSTSVGDVIKVGLQYFMVCGFGFKELVPPSEADCWDGDDSHSE